MAIKPGDRIKLFDPLLFKDDISTPLSHTIRPTTVIRRYKKQVKIFNTQKPVYDDLIDVIFDHRPNKISFAHFTHMAKIADICEELKKETNNKT